MMYSTDGRPAVARPAEDGLAVATRGRSEDPYAQLRAVTWMVQLREIDRAAAGRTGRLWWSGVTGGPADAPVERAADHSRPKRADRGKS